jgi:hypothetical protein
VDGPFSKEATHSWGASIVPDVVAGDATLVPGLSRDPCELWGGGCCFPKAASGNHSWGARGGSSRRVLSFLYTVRGKVLRLLAFVLVDIGQLKVDANVSVNAIV